MGGGGGGVKVMGFCFSWSEFSFKETYVDIDAVNSAAGGQLEAVSPLIKRRR